MSLIAMAIPILPGKEEQWRQFMSEIQGPRYNEFKESRDRYGLFERSFLQHTPMGDLVTVTLEGDDPASGFHHMTSDQSPFMNWFVQQVKEIHGFDLRTAQQGDMPEPVMNSRDRHGIKMYTGDQQFRREAA